MSTCIKCVKEDKEIPSHQGPYIVGKLSGLS